jgi:hypothetical protein
MTRRAKARAAPVTGDKIAIGLPFWQILLCHGEARSGAKERATLVSGRVSGKTEKRLKE